MNRMGLLLVCSATLLAGMLGGCAANPEVQAQAGKVQRAVARPGNTYVVRRAAVRTAGTHQAQQRRRQPTVHQQARRNLAASRVNRSVQQRRVQPSRKPTTKQAPRQLTREQYHQRYQHQKKMAAKAAAEKRVAIARAKVAQDKARQEAVRRQYVNKWQHQQRQKEKYQAKWKKQQQQKQYARQQAASKARSSRPAKRQPLHQPRKVAHKRQVVDPRQKYVARWEREQARMKAEKRRVAQQAAQRVERVIHNAKKQIGTKYVWGGASPRTGFDCSGLVQHSIRKGANVRVPRTAAQQYRAAVKVPEHQAQRGDLVFFITRGKSVSHVGIYLGGGKFVHAPRRGKRITTSRLSGYWKKRFVGFGRIPGACRVPV